MITPTNIKLFLLGTMLGFLVTVGALAPHSISEDADHGDEEVAAKLKKGH